MINHWPLHYPPCNSCARLVYDLPPLHPMTHIDFGRSQNPNITHLKWVVFCQAPKAMWHSMSGIERPPPKTTQRPKVVRRKPHTTTRYKTNNLLFTLRQNSNKSDVYSFKHKNPNVAHFRLFVQ